MPEKAKQRHASFDFVSGVAHRIAQSNKKAGFDAPAFRLTQQALLANH
jgi:hypothetical protein